MPDPDARKTLGYVVICDDGTLATDVVFGTRLRAENYMKYKTDQHFFGMSIHKVRSESEREAHRWGEPAKK